MSWTSRTLSSAIIGAALAGTAYADPPPMSPAAKAEFKSGNASLKARDYVAAIAAFDAGYALDPNPAFLYNKAQAQRLGGDCRAAVGTYKAFLATNPGATAVRYTQKNITACERILATSPVPPPVDPKSDPKTATDPRSGESGPTAIEDTGFVEPTREPTPIAPLVKPPVHATVRVDRNPWYSDRLGLAFAISGAAMLGTGVTFTLLARSDTTDALIAPDLDRWRDANSAWERDHVIAGISYGLAAGLVGAAVLRFTLADHGSSSAPAVGAAATSRGAVVILGGHW
jgi:hypothetical protein